MYFFYIIFRYNRRVRIAVRKTVKSQAFYWLIIVLVFLNSAILATEHYKQPPWLDEVQGKETTTSKNMHNRLVWKGQ